MSDFDLGMKESIEYFDGDELAANVFLTKYALRDENGRTYEKTPDDMHQRLAREFARIESQYPNPMTESEIYSLFKDFKFIVPQGSPMSGIGNPYQVQSISNCFVIPSPHDSYGGILSADQELVQIAKRRGGVGFDMSTIRPKGLSTGNAARTTDGIEVFMDRFSNSCREVAQGGRRGALMLTISVHHPQIKDFIKIKRDLKRVTGANISVRLTDEFLKAVESEENFQLRFPVEADAEHVVSEETSALEVWDEIIECAHASAEPGLLFWDNAIRSTPSDLYSHEGFASTSTNPCGEIILSPYDSCRLMVINLSSFIENAWQKDVEFNFDQFNSVVMKAQRLMDDMVDIEMEQVNKILKKIKSDPEPDHVKQAERNLWENVLEQAKKGRRTGLGVTAVGDTIAALGMIYGSDESIEVVEKIYKSLAVSAYKSSSILARERGAFPVYDSSLESKNEFLSRVISSDSELKRYHSLYGRRNIALTTTAPAGSVSVLTQTTSGIEPAYLLSYTRRKKLTENDVDGRVDFVDESGDRWQEYPVYHHGFKQWMDSTGQTKPEDSPYWGATSNDIDWVQKVKMQAAAQKWVCHAISNTTNVPSDTPVEVIKDIYMAGWKSGCKGVTVYRDGSRAGVLVSGETEPTFKTHLAPDRPKELKCSIHHASIKGEAWTILVGLMDGKPYEVMGGLQSYIEIPKKYKKGKIIKHPYKTKNSRYDLVIGKNGDTFTIKDIVAVFDNPNHAGFTRTISLALRHGAPIQYVVEQLQKDTEMDMFSFSRVIARVLKTYIKDGTVPGKSVCDHCGAEDTLRYQEGCVTCTACGHGKCG